MITLEQLRAIMPYASVRAPAFLIPLNDAMAEFGIDMPLRQAAFLAQIAHESGSLRYTREIASGQAYEGRKDLGNVQLGDGVRYRGRGLIQLTGRANYQRCSAALYGDGDILLANPELLEAPVGASRSAAWFWYSQGLNALADIKAFKRITRVINGGYNGLPERQEYYNRALRVLGCG